MKKQMAKLKVVVLGQGTHSNQRIVGISALEGSLVLQVPSYTVDYKSRLTVEITEDIDDLCLINIEHCSDGNDILMARHELEIEDN